MIHTHGLTRRFKMKKEVVEAVRGVDIDVAEGELVAFLGPNGAGKSTTLRMLTTLLRPTSGSAEVAGKDVVADPAGVRQKIGYVGQGNGAGHNYRVRDELITQGLCYGMRTSESKSRADELLKQLALAPLAKRNVSTLSGGQRRRLDVAIGLVHRPKLLFLDEPSTGLDPQSRANIWEHILRLREAFGVTLFFTTHYLDEADSMAERVIVIDHGRVIADDTPDQLKAHFAGDRITFDTHDARAAKRATEIATRVAAAREVTVDGTAIHARVTHGGTALPELLRALDAERIGVHSVDLRRPTLDDVFLALTGRSLREESRAA